MIFQFITPENVSAIEITEILKGSEAATCCGESMICLGDCLKHKNVPDSTQEIEILWNNREYVTKTLSLIFYKIIYSYKRESKNMVFHIFNPTSITLSLVYYIERILRYSEPEKGQISHSTVITALMCLDELQDRSRNKIIMEQDNIHKLFAISHFISSKFCEDSYCSNSFMSKVAGMSSEEFNSLEIIFLLNMRFKLFFNAQAYEQYEFLFENILAKMPNLEWN